MARILLAEDDPTLLDLCSAFLRSAGHHVELAHSGNEALGKVLSNRLDGASESGIHLLVLDLEMTELDVLDVCYLVRSDPYLKDLSLLVCSTSDTILQKADKYANATLLKPFDIEELLALIEGLAPLENEQ